MCVYFFKDKKEQSKLRVTYGRLVVLIKVLDETGHLVVLSDQAATPIKGMVNKLHTINKKRKKKIPKAL